MKHRQVLTAAMAQAKVNTDLHSYIEQLETLKRENETLKLNMHTTLASFSFNFGQLHVLILKGNQFLRMKMKRERDLSYLMSIELIF